eukprot:TRINITY_DN111788_c0_g1_i1.p1 TRINITY_DN111788_c0_g1~~TRINITY_DN111788_c0_g1_i1.p1  ORF type:complete len:187 (+),score=32.48 TRINITY_DN111788_c0_g1_i1:111-671(+)
MPSPRVNCMDLSPLIKTMLSHQRHDSEDFEADSDSDSEASHAPQRVNCMDLSPFIRNLNLRQHESDDRSDSGLDVADASHAPQLMNESQQRNPQQPLSGELFVPVSQERSEWGYVQQDLVHDIEGIGDELIAAALFRRTSTRLPGEMDILADCDDQSEMHDGFPSNADAPYDAARMSDSEHDGEAC